MATDPLLDAADRLYGLTLAEFTPARDALVKEHKSDKDLAAALKKLKKPSLAAWVVNLLVRRDAAQVDQVLVVGEALRQAQADLDGAELRQLTRQRRREVLVGLVLLDQRVPGRGELTQRERVEPVGELEERVGHARDPTNAYSSSVGCGTHGHSCSMPVALQPSRS